MSELPQKPLVRTACVGRAALPLGPGYPRLCLPHVRAVHGSLPASKGGGSTVHTFPLVARPW